MKPKGFEQESNGWSTHQVAKATPTMKPKGFEQFSAVPGVRAAE